MRTGALGCALVALLVLAAHAAAKRLPPGAFPATKLGSYERASTLPLKYRFREVGSGALDPPVAPSPTSLEASDEEPGQPVTNLLPDGATLAKASFHPATPVRPDQAKVQLNDTSDADLLAQLQTHTRECPMIRCKVNDDCKFKNGTCCGDGKHCCPQNAACINTNPPYCIHYTSRDPEKCAEEDCINHHHCPIEGVATCCIGGQHCCPLDAVCANTNPPSCRKLVDPKEIAEQAARMKKYAEQTERETLERHRQQAADAEKQYAAGIITEWAVQYRRAVVAHDMDVVNAKEAHVNAAKQPGNEVFRQMASVLDVQVEKSKEKMLLAEERMQKFGEFVKKSVAAKEIEEEVKTDALSVHFFGHELADRANVDDNANVVYMDTKLSLKTDGELVGWEFVAKRAGHHKLCLLSDNSLSPTIAHCTETQTKEPGLHKIKVNPPVQILKGYTVGWMHGGQGVIGYTETQTSGGDGDTDENSRVDVVRWHHYEFSPAVGDTVNFTPGVTDKISGRSNGSAQRAYSIRVAYKKPEPTQAELNEKVEEAKAKDEAEVAKEENRDIKEQAQVSLKKGAVAVADL